MYAKTVGALDIDMQVDSLVMLTSIENRLEELIEQEETLQGGTVREAQKHLEKLRRQHAREEKQRQVEQKHKERAQRAKERSSQVFQKVRFSLSTVPDGVPYPDLIDRDPHKGGPTVPDPGEPRATERHSNVPF